MGCACFHQRHTTIIQVIRVARFNGNGAPQSGCGFLMPPERRDAVITGLAREKARFLDMIDTEAVETGMRRFLEARR